MIYRYGDPDRHQHDEICSVCGRIGTITSGEVYTLDRGTLEQ